MLALLADVFLAVCDEMDDCWLVLKAFETGLGLGLLQTYPFKTAG